MGEKALKYRLYPTEEQKIFFAKTFGCCRKVYNLMLADKIQSYKDTGSFGNQTPAMYKEQYPYLKEVDSLALANVQQHLRQAVKNYFETPGFGFPKFKSKHRSRLSYTTNNQHGTVSVSDRYVKLPKIGLVRAKTHRLPKDGWELKSATVSSDRCGRYYVSVLFCTGEETSQANPDPEKVLGLDYSTKHLYVDSNGNTPGMPKYYKKSHDRLAKEQRKLSRMQGSRKGEPKSANWIRQNARVNRIHAHIANQRMDFLQKKSTEIANQYDVVGIEDISIKEQVQQRTYRNFRKSTMDNGWCKFTFMLDYKMSDRGKRLIKVDKDFPSTQTCHVCGHKNPQLKDDSIRKWICPVCGTSHDRDINAAVNIKKEAMRTVFA